MNLNNYMIKKYTKIFLLVILFFGAAGYLNYATDSYWIFSTTFEAPAKDMLTRNGRPIIALVYELAYFCRLSARSFYYISSLLSVVFLVFAIGRFESLLCKYFENENMCIIISFVSIANIFMIEYFMFIEKCGFILAVFFNVYAVSRFDSYLAERKRRELLMAIAYMMLAFFTYPGTVALFVILAMCFAFIHSDSIVKYGKNMVWILLVYGTSALTYFAVFRFLIKSVRLSSDKSIIYNIAKAGYIVISQFFLTYDILPHGIYAAIFATVFFICVRTAWNSKLRLFGIMHLLALIVLGSVFSTASIIQGSGWSVMRIVYPIASILGSLLIFLMADKSYHKGRMRVVIEAAIAVLLLVQAIGFNKVYIDKYRLNFADKLRYEYIGQAIAEYEAESGTVVSKIAFYNDAVAAQPQYPELYCTGDLVVSAFSAEWSRMTALNYYLNSNYVSAGTDSKYAEYFASKDWSVLSKEQLIFDGDTLHLCVY